MPRISVMLHQFTPNFRHNAENIEQMSRAIQPAAPEPRRLHVFPECAVSGYGFDSKEEAASCAETVPGPATDRISRACRAAAAWAVVGLLEKAGDALFNTAVLIGPDGIAGKYRKMHLPWLGADRFTTPGDLGFPVFNTVLGRLGLLICYDLSFPEAARVLKLAGAQLLILPTNWPVAAEVSCRFAPRVRAQENHINIAACNRTGEEAGFKYRGESSLCDFKGDVLTQAGPSEETVSALIDMDGADQNRVIVEPGRYELDRIGHRRPEFYERLVSKT